MTDRLLHNNWDLYDTRHVVYRPAKLTAEQLEAGYWRAYREFYSWRNIFKAAWTNDPWRERARHVAYAGGWKKFEPLWDIVIRAKRATQMLPTLEAVLSGFRTHSLAGSVKNDPTWADREPSVEGVLGGRNY